MATVPAFYVTNHKSTELVRVEDIGQLPKLFPSVHGQFPTKKEFAAWEHEEATSHCFFYLCEPVHPDMRPNADNPAKILHGIICDYDGDAATIQAALPTLKFGPGKAPAWVTTTYSGKARLMWLFEKPIPVFNGDVYKRFVKILIKELRLNMILPGLDIAIETLITPYEVGRDWRQPYGDTRLSSHLVMTALYDASAKAKFLDDVEIPLDAVAAEVERRWPGRWVGPFLDGNKGVRFWDPKADNDTGCTIRKHGVQAFTGEARFLPWSELLGVEFVKKYRESRIGAAIDGIYYDGQSFWQRDGEAFWRSYNGDSIKRRLNCTYGLGNDSKKGAASEVAMAVTSIENLRQLDGAFPYLFDPREVVPTGNHKYLNVSRVKVTPGTGQKRTWGDGFPFIQEYLQGIFGDEQLEVFLSWLAHFYQNASEGTPRQGQALFIAGPAGAGKSLLSHRVIGALMGGFGEASDYVLGKSTFNEDLFFQPVWAIDDAEAANSPQKHALFSQMVKKIVANPEQQYNAKFKKAVTQKWNGRLVVTMNDDPESIGMLPQIEHSNLDKMILVKVSRATVSFAGAEAKIREELAAFADFLRDYLIPEWLQKNSGETNRFGHDSWHNSDLIETARQASSTSGLSELLERWRIQYFRKHDTMTWTGNATDLLMELQNTENMKELVRSVAPNRFMLGKDLQKLNASGLPWLVYARSKEGRNYVINRPEDMPLPIK